MIRHSLQRSLNDVAQALGLPATTLLTKTPKKGAPAEGIAARGITLSEFQERLILHPFGALPPDSSEELGARVRRYRVFYCRLLRHCVLEKKKDSKKNQGPTDMFESSFTASDEAFIRAVLLL